MLLFRFLCSAVQYCIPKKVTLLSVCKSFFPISTNQYWYFTAYVGLFFLMPTLNEIVTSRSEQRFKKDIFNVVLLFSLYAFFIKDDFYLESRLFSMVACDSIYTWCWNQEI